jgi:eukaryotic-like serine/threonine-protein kinase
LVLVCYWTVAFQIGDIVGDYEVVGLLGRGGMGQVYKVRHRILDRMDAMKVLLPDCEDEAELLQRFEREIRVQAQLHHPNIAALHTALWVERRLLMIMEFIDGVTLEQKLREGPVAPRTTVSYVCRVLDALSYAHSAGVTHRDVKPGNIMITPGGTVKLTDFGIARTARENLTRSGIAVGSLNYMSPEQIKTGVIDHRSDIYSVGVTLYEALVGRRPFQGDGDQAVIQGHLEQDPVPPADLLPGIPVALSSIVIKSLAKDPRNRFQTAAEFHDALQSLAGAGTHAGVDSAPAAATRIDPAVLSQIERCLAAAVGPIAKALMARTAPRVRELAELRRKLAEHIPDESARQKFFKCCERHGDTTARKVDLGASTNVYLYKKPDTVREWNPAFLEQAERELARYIGPMARTVVNKASKKTQTVPQLIELLGDEIPDTTERGEFISRLRRA